MCLVGHCARNGADNRDRWVGVSVGIVLLVIPGHLWSGKSLANLANASKTWRLVDAEAPL